VTADAVLGLIGGALLAVLSWIAVMLFGMRERMSLLEQRFTAHQEAAEVITDLRGDRHYQNNHAMAAQAVHDDHERRLSAVEDIADPVRLREAQRNREREPSPHKWPRREDYKTTRKA
jgi:hypothetical protein